MVKFKEIEIDIPEVILELAENIEKLEKDSCLAGGFLSDLYMGTPYRDVDFFIKYPQMGETQFIEALMKMMKTDVKQSSESYYHQSGIYNVYESTYHGYKLNFILNIHGANSASYFDTSFREFYHHDGKTFASLDALSDIKDRKLRLGIMDNPIVAMFRLFRFKERYGFSILEKYTEPVGVIFIHWGYTIQNVNDYLQDLKCSDDVKNEMTSFFNGIMANNGLYHDKKLAFLQAARNNTTVTREIFHEIFFKDDEIKSTFTFSLSKDHFYKKLQNAVVEIKKEFHKQQIRLSLDYPELVNEWKNNMDDPHYFHLMFLPKIQRIANNLSFNQKSYLKEITEKIMMMNTIMHLSSSVDSSIIKIDVCEEKSFQHNIDASEYLKGRYIHLSVDQVFSFPYDLFDDKTLWDYSQYEGYDSFFPFINEAIEKTKQLIEEKKRMAV